uniref:Uncharacterized protein n=1 Tax=Megaselia scalaris TaxID=36166 RepID=T1GSK8_MEGSC
MKGNVPLIIPWNCVKDSLKLRIVNQPRKWEKVWLRWLNLEEWVCLAVRRRQNKGAGVPKTLGIEINKESLKYY